MLTIFYFFYNFDFFYNFENFWQFWQISGKHLRFAENCQIFVKISDFFWCKWYINFLPILLVDHTIAAKFKWLSKIDLLYTWSCALKKPKSCWHKFTPYTVYMFIKSQVFPNENSQIFVNFLLLPFYKRQMPPPPPQVKVHFQGVPQVGLGTHKCVGQCALIIVCGIVRLQLSTLQEILAPNI